MIMSKKVAMVKPVSSRPAKISQQPAKGTSVSGSEKPVDLSAALRQLGNDRPFTVIEIKPDYWLVQFLGDAKPTKVLK
jgi:hypothetical protein